MTNKEVIEQYGNNPIIMEEMMSYLLLNFKEDPRQNTISCIKKFLKDETLVDNLVNVINRDKMNNPNNIIDAEFTEIVDNPEPETTDQNKDSERFDDGDWV